MTANATKLPILEARGLTKRFVKKLDFAGHIVARLVAGRRDETVNAVDDVSLQIGMGEVVGLVGESGCGKSTLGRMIAGLLEPTEGTVWFKGRNRAELVGVDAKAARLAMQMIFQDPYASLNPLLRVEAIIGEAPVAHGQIASHERADYVAELLARVGLESTMMRRYPHQFSGGQRSRIGIARALAVRPELLICDEATAALDVSIQAQVINLFMEMRSVFDLTYLFISHDLGVVQHFCDRVIVMYLGRIVEVAPAQELFGAPNHPYSRALLADMPRISVGRRTSHPIEGEIPSGQAPPSGCHFHPRCPHALPRCAAEAPRLREVWPGRHSACHLNGRE